MSQSRILVFVGSLRKESFNRRLAEGVEKLAPDNLSFTHARIDNLPLYNQDDDSNQADTVKQLKQDIRESDGVLFVTPEYNRSIPGVLKNAIDNASRPYGDSAWAGKPAGILGASIGAIGTAIAQQHLRNSLAYLDMPTLGQPEAFIHVTDGLFEKDGSIGAASRDFLKDWINRYADWVKRHTK